MTEKIRNIMKENVGEEREEAVGFDKKRKGAQGLIVRPLSSS